MSPTQLDKKSRKSRHLGGLASLLVFLLIFVAVLWQWQPLLDAVRLYNYKAPAAVAQLATDTTMTDTAKHLYYINHPQIQGRSAFAANCSSQDEQTIVLGCYHGYENGIYIFGVTDPRLNGVEQVTAAHEMLHAAYDRLSGSEKTQVDGWLMDYYQHDLTDARIKATIAAYQRTEPHDVVNEMHSVFGTEASNLPANLEHYYSRYFTNRSAIVAYADHYQAEFTSRQAQVATDDQQLAALKNEIDTDNQQLQAKQASLVQQQTQLDQLRNSNPKAYNQAIPAYNSQVDSYNSLVTETSQLISRYNQLVKIRNDLAVQVNQLAQAINSQPAPISGQ